MPPTTPDEKWSADGTHEEVKWSPQAVHVEDAEKAPSSPVPEKRVWENLDEGLDPVVIKRAMRKIDWRLLPILAAMYCVALMDRTNLAYTRAANEYAMDIELGLSIGNRYSMITIIFFVPYIILEIPSQIGLRKFGAKWWLGGSVVLWGIVTMCLGFVKRWDQMVGGRAVLGVLEATLFPGSALLIACWYPRRFMAQRTAWFYMAATIAANLTTPLGYGFSQLDGKGGYHGWRWMFILAGVLTVIVGFISIVAVVDFPDKATFLTPEEKHVITTRIERDRNDSEFDPLTLKKCLVYATDMKVWLFAFFFTATTCATYSLAYFLPVILMNMGFDNVGQMLLPIPCYFWALVPSFGGSYFSDKYRGMRANTLIFNCLCLIVGTCMYSQLSNQGARYAGIFLAVGGSSANVSIVVSWGQTSIRSQSKRAFNSALTIAGGGIGGILAGVIFIQKEAAKGYPTGVYFTIAMNALTVVAAFCLSMYFRYMNKRAERGEAVIEGDENFRYQP